MPILGENFKLYVRMKVSFLCWANYRYPICPHTLTHLFIYLSYLSLNMYAFIREIIVPYIFTSHLLGVAYKKYGILPGANLQIQAIT